MTTTPSNLLGLDFESYFNTKTRVKTDKFTLKDIPPLVYVRDPRFKAHGCAVKFNDATAFWVTHNELPEFFSIIDWANTTAYAHNALFDGLILHEIYGYAPSQWIDTVGLAHALLPPNVPADLATLARGMRVGHKGKELDLANGIYDLPADIESTIAEYSKNDIELTYRILKRLYPHLPKDERQLMSMTARWGTVAKLNVNRELLHRALADAVTKRNAAIKASGYTATQLTSLTQFPAILRSLGIDPPIKLNDKGEETNALAKNDIGFVQLMADYPQYRHIWQGRLAANSNNTIKKIELFIRATENNPTIVMPLNYYGAHTGRWTGAGGLNVQALERKSPVRYALEAPKEHVVVVADSSQIELRMNAWFSNEETTLNILRNGEDVYSHTATAHFGYPVTKKMPERQFGKMLDLALGYNMGVPKFRTQAAVGIMGTPPVNLTEDEATRAVYGYRNGHSNIKGMWRWLGDTAIPHMSQKDKPSEEPLRWKCVTFTHEACNLPNGMQLQYPDLQISEEGQWSYETTEGRVSLHGGKLLENIIQALARIAVAEQLIKIEEWLPDFTNFSLVSSTHDEGIGIVLKRYADFALNAMICIFSEPPTWAPDLPLTAEGGYAHNYCK
jgi:hypothetical protein